MGQKTTKLPVSLNILGDEYTIKQVNAMPDGTDDYGELDYEKRTIYVLKRLNTRESLLACFHEMGHALLRRNSLHFSGAFNEYIEEIIVDSFANLMYDQFVKENVFSI